MESSIPEMASLAETLVVALMCISFALAVVAHAQRRELDPVEMPFSAYLSGVSRRVGLACYAALGCGIVLFAVAAGLLAHGSIALAAATVLYLASAAFLAIAAATARADLPLSHENPRARWWHRRSSFLAFLCVIIAVALHVSAWRASVFAKVWPLPAYFAAILAALFIGLWFAPLHIKGAVQKLLIAGIVGWFSWAALLMRS